MKSGFRTFEEQQKINKWIEIKNILYVGLSIVLFTLIFSTLIILQFPIYTYFIGGIFFIFYMIKLITYINK